MKQFWHIQAISLIYAVVVLVTTQLMLNVYRINRLTQWDIGTINILTLLVNCIVVIGGAILLMRLTKKWLHARKEKYWSVVLWIPYFFILSYVFNFLFPITYGGYRPNPATNLLIIGGLLIYPLYVILINFVSTYLKQQMKNK